jgi:hypothetical protein
LQQTLDMFEHRIEGAVGVVGGTTQRNTRAVLVLDAFMQRLHQTGLANAGFPAQQHHLSQPLAALCPVLQARSSSNVMADPPAMSEDTPECDLCTMLVSGLFTYCIW